jgi:RimJ/RimL family protein N-acetyltransferase
MINITLEKRCNFSTPRLSVCSWTNHTKEPNAEKKLAEKVIEILSPNVTRALPDGWQNITSFAAAQEWVKDRNEESHFLSIQLSSTNEIIGFIFLYEAESENQLHNLRFGYLLAENFWGIGLGTELTKGLLDWCKAAGDIKSISGGVEKDNIGSIKVLEKTGFAALPADGTSDLVVFYAYQFHIQESP